MAARVATFRCPVARTLLCAALLAAGCGETEEPVRWTASIDGTDTVAPGSVVRVKVEARSGRGWYFYSATQPAGGPIPARIQLADSTVFRQAGPLGSPDPSRSFDSVFGIDLEKYPGSATFTLPVRVPLEGSSGRREIRISALYQACNDVICLSPRTVVLTVPVMIESP
ncbi:MAG: protein-disulfide reductase DsbD domain-containing protein [Gemmatimonadaceae bacterium]